MSKVKYQLMLLEWILNFSYLKNNKSLVGFSGGYIKIILLGDEIAMAGGKDYSNRAVVYFRLYEQSRQS